MNRRTKSQITQRKPRRSRGNWNR